MLIKLVDDLEVAVTSADHVLVDEVEGGVGYELVKVSVVVLPNVPGSSGYRLIASR